MHYIFCDAQHRSQRKTGQERPRGQLAPATDHANQGLHPLIATLLFCASSITLGQFGLYYWRTRMRCISALPVSDRVRVTARITTSTVGSHDFRAILDLYDSVPHLGGCTDRFRAIRMYHAVVEKLGHQIPSMAKWSEVEMTSCSRYVAVLVDRHIQHNIASASQMLVL
jgi:hypothetical protein